MWQPAAHIQKKGHVSLQNIFCQRRRKKKKRKHEWEEDKVFVHQHTTHTEHYASQQTALWAEWRPYHYKPTAESLISATFFSTNTRAHQVYRLAPGRFRTSDLYRHLKLLLNSRRQNVVDKVASYILFETRCKYDTPPKLSTSTWFISIPQLLICTVWWTIMWYERCAQRQTDSSN